MSVTGALRAPLAAAVPMVCAAALALGPIAPPAAAGISPLDPLLVGTYNIRAGVSTETFASSVAAFYPRVDLAGLQEVNSKAKEAVLASLSVSGWDYFRARPGEQTPVLWDGSRFSLLSARNLQLSPRTYVGNEVPHRGPYLDALYATVVRLTDRLTGKTLSVTNVHLVAGAVKGGRNWSGRPLTYALYVTQMRNLAAISRAEEAWAHLGGGSAFTLGDFNVGFVADQKHQVYRLPYATFGRQARTSMWATEHPAVWGTHNDALIDQVYSRQRAVAAKVQFDIDGSDHRPAIATYVLP